jgi:hypothetical protein
VPEKIWFGSLQKIKDFEDLGIDGKIIVKSILRRQTHMSLLEIFLSL